MFVDTQSGMVTINGREAQLIRFIGYGLPDENGNKDRIWSVHISGSRTTTTVWESSIEFLGQDKNRLVKKYEGIHKNLY